MVLPVYVKNLSVILKSFLLKNKKSKIRNRFLEQEQDIDSPITVFWSLDAGMKPHYISQCILARTLQELGHRVLMLHCFQYLSRCVVKDASQIPINATKMQNINVCNSCAKNGIELSTDYGLPILDLGVLIDEAALKAVHHEMKIFSGDFSDFIFEGIEFGKICAGEVVRVRKLCNWRALTNENLTLQKKYIETAILSYLAFKKLTQRYKKINRVLFFGDYSLVMGLIYYANQNNIPTTNITHTSVNNIDPGKLVLMSALSLGDYFLRVQRWPEWGRNALTSQQVEDISADIIYRLSGSGATIYSPNKTFTTNTLLKDMSLSSERKTLVAFTSSLDEVLATRLQYEALGNDIIPTMGPFENQIDWLQALVSFVEESCELQLIVRIHPREGEKSSLAGGSEHLIALREAFSGKFKHIRFVWPEDNVSSYDLGEIADLVLIGWTSLGLEMARLGVPVMAAFRYMAYPYGDLIEWEETKKYYFNKITMLLSETIDMEKIKKAFRWFNILRLGATVDIGDMAPGNDFRSLPQYRKPSNSQILEDVLIKGKELVEINMEKLKKNSHENEEQAIQLYLRRIIWFLLFGEKRENDYILTLILNSKIDENDILFEAEDILAKIVGSDVVFGNKMKRVKKYSPMLARLILLGAQKRIFQNENSQEEVIL